MKEISISVRLSKDEFEALEMISKEAEITKAEYLRLIIRGIWLGKTISEGKKSKLVMGEYGYSFHPEQMEELFKEIAKKLENAVEISPIINKKRVRYKNIKTRKEVA
jgi:type II secretory pathway component GspD/PulD (secretin)